MRRRLRRLPLTALTAVLAGAATACRSPDTTVLPPPTGPFVISPSAAFAGSIVTIHSADFRTRGTGAALTVGDTDVTLARADDTTMSARLPATVGGVLTPILKLDGYQLPLGALTVYGYVELKKFDQNIGSDM